MEQNQASREQHGNQQQQHCHPDVAQAARPLPKALSRSLPTQKARKVRQGRCWRPRIASGHCSTGHY
jgi:hypothetical protein